MLIRDGVVDQDALKKETLTEVELLSVIHKQGLNDFSEVEKCVLEPNGTFYVEPMKPSDAATRNSGCRSSVPSQQLTAAGPGRCGPVSLAWPDESAFRSVDTLPRAQHAISVPFSAGRAFFGAGRDVAVGKTSQFESHVQISGDVRADVGWNQHGVAAAGEPGVSAAGGVLRRRRTSRALRQYEAMYQRSIEDPEGFWAEAAAELDWFAAVGRGAVRRHIGFAKWFAGGKLNLCHNCVDRHAAGARKDKVALLWEGEPGEVRRHHLRANCTRRCSDSRMC